MRTVAPHKYRPEPMLMGDCRVCGNVRDAAVHTVEFAAGYREALEDIISVVASWRNDVPMTGQECAAGLQEHFSTKDTP